MRLSRRWMWRLGIWGRGYYSIPRIPFQLADHFAWSEMARSPRSGLVDKDATNNPVIKRA